MKNIDEFLKKFTVIENPSSRKEDICSVFKKVCGIAVLPDNLTIKKGVIILNVHSSLKSIVYTHKEKLLEVINSTFNDLKITKII